MPLRRPPGRWAVPGRGLLVRVGITLWWRSARLEQGIERRRGARRLRHLLPREEPLLGRRRPRFTGKPRPGSVIRICAFLVTVLPILVRRRPLSAPVVAGRLAAVAGRPRVRRHRRFCLCVHDAIGRNAPDGLVGAVL